MTTPARKPRGPLVSAQEQARTLRREVARLRSQADRLEQLAGELDGDESVTDRELEDDVVRRLTRAGEI